MRTLEQIKDELKELAEQLVSQMNDDDKSNFLSDPEGWREGIENNIAYSDIDIDTYEKENPSWLETPSYIVLTHIQNLLKEEME
jgi:hypothetical protein